MQEVKFMIDIVFVEALGTVFFFLLTAISAYFYRKNPENTIPVFLSAAMFFLFIREATYFLVDSELIMPEFKMFGGFVSFLAGILFLYVFVAEERTLKDIRRIRNAFK